MRALAISAHPDDETLGCGGTLLRHLSEGDEVFWAVVTQPHEPQWSAELIQRKTIELAQVARAYSVVNPFILGFPSARLETVPQTELMDSLRNVIEKAKPQVVYLTYGGDVHSDHRLVFQAAISILKPWHMASSGVRRVLCYETLSSTESASVQGNEVFNPNVFSDISPFIEGKLEIMEMYQSESQADPMPRGPSSIRALARHRGATFGVEYAEAFVLIRELL